MAQLRYEIPGEPGESRIAMPFDPRERRKGPTRLTSISSDPLSDYSRAVLDWQHDAADDPFAVEAWINFARASLASGRLKEAIKAFDVALACGRGNAYALKNLAQEAANAGMWRIVNLALSEPAAIDAGDVHLSLLKAQSLLKTNVLGEAEVITQKVLQYDPNNTSALLLLSDVKRKRGQAAVAEELLRSVVSITNGLAESHSALLKFLIATGRFDDAERHLGDVPLFRLDDPLVLCVKAELAAARGDIGNAVKLFENVLSQDPSSIDALWGLGSAHLYKLGDKWRAFECGRRLVAISPTETNSYILFADAAKAIGQQVAAIDKLSDFLFLSPRDTEIGAKLVRLLIEKREFPSAVRVAEPFLRANPRSAIFAVEAAIARAANGEWLSVLKEMRDSVHFAKSAQRANVIVRIQMVAGDPALPVLLANATMGTWRDLSLGFLIFETLVKSRDSSKAMVWARALVRHSSSQLERRHWLALSDGATYAGRFELAKQWNERANGLLPASSEAATIDETKSSKFDDVLLDVRVAAQSGRLDVAEDRIVGAARFFADLCEFTQLAFELALLKGNRTQAVEIFDLIAHERGNAKLFPLSVVGAGLGYFLQCGDLASARQVVQEAIYLLQHALLSEKAELGLTSALSVFVIRYGESGIVFPLIADARKSGGLATASSSAVLVELLQRGGLPQSLEYVEDALALPPENFEVWYSASRCMVKCEKWDRAEQAIRILLRERPNHVGALELLATILEKTDRNEEALATLRAVYVLSNGSVAKAQTLARALRRTGALNGEIEALRREVAHFPKDFALQLQLASCLLESGELAAADSLLAVFRKLRLCSLDIVELHVAVRYFRMDFGGANTLIATSGIQWEASPQALRRLSLLHRRLTNTAETVHLLRRAAGADDKDVATGLLLAEQLFETGKLNEALLETERLLSLDSLDGRVYLLRSKLFLQRGDSDASRTALGSALLLNSQDPACLMQAGLLAEHEGRYAEARTLFADCLEASRLDGQVPGPRTLWHLTMCSLITGETGKAVAAHAGLCDVFNEAFPSEISVWGGEALVGRSLLIGMRGGPGDELRIATMTFPWLLEQGLERCTFACDPRLEELLRRTFPEMTFVAAPSGHRQLRRINDETGPVLDRSWPGLSNRSVEMSMPFAEAESHDFVTHSDGLMQRVYFEGVLADGKSLQYRHLIPDGKRSQSWRSWLDRLGPGLKVGLCWRGSYASSYRNRHFLVVDEIVPRLTMPGIVLIDLQVNKNDDERSVLISSGVHTAPSLNLYDDFEGVAALMSQLDLIITPGVTMRDLAGALQVPTWSLIVSPGVDDLWRKGEGAMDCWQASIRHYDVNQYDGKFAMISAVAADLAALRDSADKVKLPKRGKKKH